MEKLENKLLIDLHNSSAEREHFSQRIIILQYLAFMGLITSFFYSGIFYFIFNSRLASIVVFSCGVAYFLGYLASRCQHFKLARHILASTFIFEITIHSVYLFPKEANFQIYFLVSIVLIYLLFTQNQKISRVFYVCTSIVLLIAIDVFQFSFTPINPLSAENITFIRACNTFSSVFVLAVTIYLFARLMETSEQESRKQALTDPLTDLINRRHFFTLAKQMLLLNKRNPIGFSIIFLDIDHFKKINDQYGHDIGDQTLKTFADTLRDNVRNTDIVARIGGEEFIILFPNTSKKHAFAKAEVIRLAVMDSKLPVDTLHLTTSIGVAEVEDTDDSINQIIVRADKALYNAKNSGRNKTIIYSEKLDEGGKSD